MEVYLVYHPFAVLGHNVAGIRRVLYEKQQPDDYIRVLAKWFYSIILLGKKIIYTNAKYMQQPHRYNTYPQGWRKVLRVPGQNRFQKVEVSRKIKVIHHSREALCFGGGAKSLLKWKNKQKRKMVIHHSCEVLKEFF